MVSVATKQNRTISFDFLPVHSTEIDGYQFFATLEWVT